MERDTGIARVAVARRPGHLEMGVVEIERRVVSSVEVLLWGLLLMKEEGEFRDKAMVMV